MGLNLIKHHSMYFSECVFISYVRKYHTHKHVKMLTEILLKDLFEKFCDPRY